MFNVRKINKAASLEHAKQVSVRNYLQFTQKLQKISEMNLIKKFNVNDIKEKIHKKTSKAINNTSHFADNWFIRMEHHRKNRYKSNSLLNLKILKV